MKKEQMKKIELILTEKMGSEVMQNEFATKLSAAEHIFTEIFQECGQSFYMGCGSYLFDGQTYQYNSDMFPKQQLLYSRAKEATSVLEVGSYMGHSILIMLLANPKLHVVSVDISDQYIVPAIRVLKRHFPDAQINFYHNDSLHVLPKLEKIFDLFHIDGHHAENHIRQEFALCKKLSKYVLNDKNIMRIIFDDISCCEAIISNIAKEYTCITQIRPNCPWPNAYLEIEVAK